MINNSMPGENDSGEDSEGGEENKKDSKKSI